ncbi:hypothetical protein EV359DRAFT_65200 [Lentinula novae-zelandiae]|nr:hypothetical protein EV359DRAFT_65200 [Lentinula novae-zelandiae]
MLRVPCVSKDPPLVLDEFIPSAPAVSQNSTRVFSSGRTPFEAAMEKLMDPDEATALVASSKRAISDNRRLGISTKPTTQVPIPPIIRITTGPAASAASRNSMRGYSAAQNAEMAPAHRNSSQLAHPPSSNGPIQTTQGECSFQRNSQIDRPSSPNNMELILRIRDTVCAFPYISDIPRGLDDMRKFKFTIAKGPLRASPGCPKRPERPIVRRGKKHRKAVSKEVGQTEENGTPPILCKYVSEFFGKSKLMTTFTA